MVWLLAVPDREVLVHSAANDPQQLSREIAELTSVSETVVVQVPYAIALFPTIAQLTGGRNACCCCAYYFGRGKPSLWQSLVSFRSVSILLQRLSKVKRAKELLAEARDIFDTYASETEIMAVGLTTPEQIGLAATIGVDAVTISPALLDKLMA